MIRLLELGDWRHGKSRCLTTVLLPINDSPGKSFENLLSGLPWEPVVGKGKQQLCEWARRN